MALRDAIDSLNRRVYAGWESFDVDWEGPALPPMFRRLFARNLAYRDLEARVGDPEWHREAFLFHFLLGAHYGYPSCCVLQFACEATAVRPLGERRLGFVDYVPCDACLQKYIDAYHAGEPDGGLVPQQLVEP